MTTEQKPFKIGKALNADEIRPYWINKAQHLLLGRVVKQVRYLVPEEIMDLGWDQCAIALLLVDPDGKADPVWLFPSSDEEGNDAGVLFTDSEDTPTIPKIPPS